MTHVRARPESLPVADTRALDDEPLAGIGTRRNASLGERSSSALTSPSDRTPSPLSGQGASILSATVDRILSPAENETPSADLKAVATALKCMKRANGGLTLDPGTARHRVLPTTGVHACDHTPTSTSSRHPALANTSAASEPWISELGPKAPDQGNGVRVPTYF